MATPSTVTVTVVQLQDLLQAQTASLEQLVTNQIANLQENLEATIDQKLQSKFDAAETSVKKFMKESIEEDDDADNQNNTRTSSDLNFIKDHVLQMEQSMTAQGFKSNSSSNLNSNDTKSSAAAAPAPETLGTNNYSKMNNNKAKTSSSSTNNNNNNNNDTSAILEQTLHKALERMEESLDDHMEQLTKQVDQHLKKMTASNLLLGDMPPNRSASSSSASKSLHRSASLDQSNHSVRVEQKFEDALSSRMATMEQFIDSRHSELEAYYSSASDKLHKLVQETIQDSFYRFKAGVTKAELEAILDKRIDDANSDDDDDDEDEDDDDDNDNQDGDSKTDISNNKLGYGISKSPKRPPSQDTGNNGNSNSAATAKALEQLLQQQKAWIDVQNSTSDLEQQVQRKLQDLEGGASASASLQMVHGKLDSLEKVVLAAMATSAVDSSNHSKKRRSNNSSNAMKNDSSKRSIGSGGGGGGASMIDDSSKRASVSDIADHMMGGSSKGTLGNNSRGGGGANADDYMDVSVDGQRLRSMNADLDENNKSASGGDGGDRAVKSFMSTLNNWRDLSTKEKGIREHKDEDNIDDIDDDVEISDSDNDDDIDDAIDDNDDDDIDDDIDDANDDDIDDDNDDDIDVADANNVDEKGSSNGSLSVDSSFNDDDDEANAVSKAVAKALGQLEGKMDRVEECVRALTRSGYTNGSSGSSNNGMTLDEIEEMVINANDTLKSDLKEWMLEQQESTEQSQSGQPTGGDSREVSSASALASQDDIDDIRSKLDDIEGAVATNQEILQESRQRALAPMPQELPLQRDIMLNSNHSSAELERKILSHLNAMDTSVQFKLDEIFAELQKDDAGRRASGASAISTDDQTAISQAVQSHLRGLQAAVISHLEKSIPDYGMASSVIRESLEEIRQIVSEVAISEVELLKTQLGVAEEAEQEAINAIVVLQGKLEETKEQDYRAHQAPTRRSTSSSGGLFNLGPFGNLAGALSGGQGQQQAQRPPRERYGRKMSMGSHVSNLSNGSLGYHVPHHVNRGRSAGVRPLTNKRQSPAEKLESWQNQFADMEDKSTDLRALYTQLRGQGAEDWIANDNQRNQAAPEAAAVPAKSSLKSSRRYAAEESKEMEDLTDADGDWT